MNKVTLRQWNKEWSNVNSGCRYQTSDETEVHLAMKRFNPRVFQVVRIECNDYPDMFGIADDTTVERMQNS